MKRATFYALIPFLVALALRLYPTLISGLPFSTDAWSPIRNTELLLERTPIHLGDDKVFDGYNNYWPANSLFGAVFSHVTGLKAIEAMAISTPLIGALAILIFYALVNKVIRDSKIAFIASILLATVYPYALFTAGVTKETYANPLYLLVFLVSLTSGKWRKIFLLIMASVALVLSHHLTVFVAIAVLASLALSTSINRVREGLGLDKSIFIPVSILTTVTALYYRLYAYAGLKLTITISDWLSAASYQLVAFALALYFMTKPRSVSYRRTLLKCITATALPSFVIFLCTKRPILPDAPILPGHYLIYASPFILSSPLIVLGIEELGEMRGEQHTAPFFWFATILGLGGYALFGGLEMGLTLAYRTLNFLSIPLVILCAVGLYRFYFKTSNMRTQKLIKLAATATLILIAGLNAYDVYASVSLQERYMGYFWLYMPQEFKAATWTATTAINRVVAADVKVSYLLKGYYNLSVDEIQGFKYLTGKTSAYPQILFIYNLMLKNGYVFYEGLSVDLPENLTEKTYDLNLIYSNGLVRIYHK